MPILKALMHAAHNLKASLAIIAASISICTAPTVAHESAGKPDANGPEQEFEVVSSETLNDLSNQFRNSKNDAHDASVDRHSGWLGADAAYTLPIGGDQTLWMFGDTFVRTTDKSQFDHIKMFNNSVGVQHINAPQEPIKFFWHPRTGGLRTPLLATSQSNKWLWPLDGIEYHGVLYEFMNVVEKSRKSEPTAFKFNITNQLLMKVKGTLPEPNTWKIRMNSLKASHLQFGNALISEGVFCYTFDTFEPARKGIEKHPIIVARLPLSELEKMHSKTDVGKSWEFWCQNSTGASWKKPGKAELLPTCNPVVVMQDGAPEFSVTRIKGLDGFFAIYFPAGFSKDIVMRHASRPEGPWSAPQKLYECKVTEKDHIVYSAKTHQELATAPGELIITYCENSISSLASPETAEKYYFPHAIKIAIRKVSPPDCGEASLPPAMTRPSKITATAADNPTSPDIPTITDYGR